MKNAQKLQWDLRRFGMTPRHLLARVIPPNAPRILSISIPKSGTHLLEKALCEHPDIYRPLLPTIRKANLELYGGLKPILQNLKNGQLIVAHIPYNLQDDALIKSLKIHQLFIYRDPRDVLLSLINHISTFKPHPLRSLFPLKENSTNPMQILASKPLNEKIDLFIQGDEINSVNSILQWYRNHLGWLNNGGFKMSYESLIGVEGGGSVTEQKSVLKKLYSYLELEVSDRFILQTAQNIFSTLSPTFNKGTINRWKEVLSTQQQEQILNLGQDIFDAYGYN